MKLRITATVAAVAIALMAITAFATSPHFIGAPSIAADADSLEVKFKAAGLGNVDTATFNLTGDVTLFSRCYNRGGNKPQADNKQETIAIDSTETFPVRNGQTTGTFTITYASTLECPGNQVVVVESFTYDLTLSGQGLSYHFTN